MTSKSLTLVLLVVCAVLILMMLFRTPSVETALKTNDVKLGVELGDMTWQRSIEKSNDYIAVSEQPLFEPSRRKQVQKLVEVAPISQPKPREIKTQKPLPQLIGVMQVDGVDMAFVLGEGDSEPVMLSAGDSYQGWSVSKLRGNEIVLEKQGEEAVVTLDWGAVNHQFVGQPTPKTTVLESSVTGMPRSPSKTIRLKDRLAHQIQGGDYEFD